MSRINRVTRPLCLVRFQAMDDAIDRYFYVQGRGPTTPTCVVQLELALKSLAPFHPRKWPQTVPWVLNSSSQVGIEVLVKC